MNKYLLTPFAVAALMLASCTQEEFVTNGSGDGNVIFTAQLPEGMNTRAFSDGYTATQLQYAVYDEEGKHLDGYGDSETITLNGRKATVSLSLITGKEYTIVFWAYAENSPYSFDKETGVVTVNSTTTTATDTDTSDDTNTAGDGDESASEDAATTDKVITGPSQDETRDAFFATESFKVTGSINKTITLTRPFAQINIGTSDIKEFTNAGGKITESGMTVKGYGKLNLLTGEASEEVTYEFYNIELPTESFPYEASTYTTYLAMNYILVPADKQTVDVTWTSDNTNRNEVTFNSVPVQRNYRTNIFGALLTNPAEFNVVIDNSYISDDKDIDDYVAEYDAEGYRVADSVKEANALLAAGETAVSVDGEHFNASSVESTVSAVAMTRTDDEFEGVTFYLNKTIPHQKLKITGEAKADVKVTYATVGEGETQVANPVFTLVIEEKAKGVVLNLSDANVIIDGKKDNNGNKATVESVTFEDADSAKINMTNVLIDEVTQGENFDGEIEFEGLIEVTSAEELIDALQTIGDIIIDATANIDLTQATIEQLTVRGRKTLNVAENVTITLGNTNYFTINDNFNLNGPGTITNVNSVTPETGTAKLLFKLVSGDFVANDIELINDPSHHYYDQVTYTYNSSTLGIYKNANVEMNNVKAISGEFVICSYERQISQSVTKFTNCEFESTSSTANGTGSWAYAVKLAGKTSEWNNCTVKGIQGALSFECVEVTINGGDYYTHYLDEVNKTGNPYSALYVTNSATVTVLDGKFYSPTPGRVGSLCVRAGDNDVDYPAGTIILKGGKYNGKAYNHDIENDIIEPAEGYKYEANTGDDSDRYTWLVVPEDDAE